MRQTKQLSFLANKYKYLVDYWLWNTVWHWSFKKTNKLFVYNLIPPFSFPLAPQITSHPKAVAFFELMPLSSWVTKVIRLLIRALLKRIPVPHKNQNQTALIPHIQAEYQLTFWVSVVSYCNLVGRKHKPNTNQHIDKSTLIQLLHERGNSHPPKNPV